MTRGWTSVHGSDAKGSALLPFSNWLEVLSVRGLSGGRNLTLFLDLDGTLAPIVSDPAKTRVPKGVLETLGQLQNLPRVRIGIISGRSLHKTRELVKVPGLVRAGNHGLEIEGPGLYFVHPRARKYQGRIARICRNLEGLLQGYEGVLVENKGLSASIHYRCVDRAYHKDIFAAVGLAVADEVEGIAQSHGKKVIELRPEVGWNKGTAVLHILRSFYGPSWQDLTLTLYMGDDETDEDAFLALKGQGVTVLVGKPERKTAAAYYLDHFGEVEPALKELLSMVRKSDRPG